MEKLKISKAKPKGTNPMGYLSLLLLTMACLAVTIFVHMAAWFDASVEWGILKRTLTEAWNKHTVGIVVVEWLPYIWIFIYTAQVLWLLYSSELLIRKTKAGTLLFDKPSVMPPSIFIIFIFALPFDIAWVVFFDVASYMKYAPLFLVMCAIFLYLALAISFVKVKRFDRELQTLGLYRDVWLIGIFVQNGIAMYGTWIFVLLLNNSAIIANEYEVLSPSGASYIYLGVMMGYVIVWFVMDVFIQKESLHRLLSPYLVCIAAFTMVVYANLEEKNTRFMIGSVFLVFTSTLTLVKLAIAIGYSRGKRYR